MVIATEDNDIRIRRARPTRQYVRRRQPYVPSADDDAGDQGAQVTSFEDFPRNPTVHIRYGRNRISTRFGQTSDDITERVLAPSQTEMARVAKRDLKRYYELISWHLETMDRHTARLLFRALEFIALPGIDELQDWSAMVEGAWLNQKSLREEFDEADVAAAVEVLSSRGLTERLATLDALERAFAYVHAEGMGIVVALQASGLVPGDGEV
jgi:hypothetical protein